MSLVATTPNTLNDAHGEKATSPLSLGSMPIDVISIQSQVVYGSVGNSIAVPTLQAMGLRVASLPTVLLSNTPHYPTLHGGIIPIEWFSGYLEDLIERGITSYLRALLIGYIGNVEQVKVLARWIERVLSKQPDLKVLVDPVMGDEDVGIYIDPKLIPVYQEMLAPLAYGLTPNRFELGKISGHDIASTDQAIMAARNLIKDRMQWITVTSAALNISQTEKTMDVAVITREKFEIISHDYIPSHFRGTGDLFSAKLLSYILSGNDVFIAAHLACADVISVIKNTIDIKSEELILEKII